MGGLDEKVTENVLWELMVQAGPVTSVNMPKDRVTANHQGSVEIATQLFTFCLAQQLLCFVAFVVLVSVLSNSWGKKMLIMLSKSST